MASVGPRVKSVPPLTKILPPGTEGGKEFGRIAGLLLFNDAKRRGLEFNLFDDASGDYEGLDGFSRDSNSEEVVGYQYKFFPSPLSNAHRQQIAESLAHALERTDTLKLVKWVLVTPDDFKNSALKKGGGDVEWFERLREKNKDKLEIEHVGHTKLQDLFLQTHHLCLFYYPVHIQAGTARKKSIQQVRAQYDDNMRKLFGKVEFVGMSVYKEEASRRIPLENIYIPLSVVSERAPDESDVTPRIDPLTFLNPGSKTVILGDPGSGKSTLLGFLALVGISDKLQSRCGFPVDKRLAVVVTLRRYADELKLRKNLSILEYVREVAAADFNMSMLESDFYEYYMESGQAIVLFDGLDELPGAHFKDIIRRRIESFVTSFPANTIVVSSRLVGYEAEVRFDDSYDHYRVSKLKICEIKRFIEDWYSVRVEDPIEKARNANDLIKVITLPESDSIRALARNPLLLTIVALVHRIDAVLPDQRVVLYQKCTETLLNTWYKAKRQDDEIIKGRIEQRNRVRVESIAYWMHRKSIGMEGRSVAKHKELLDFLADHINENEKLRESDDHAEDQAEAFLNFIKNSAGLLVEAGDGLYSFIHLTFQEYLCATHLLAFGETQGAQSIWDELDGELQNPRWREVARLLIASLKSTSGKAFFIDKLLDQGNTADPRDTSLLLTGLLRDSIEPAENRASEIFLLVLKTLSATTKLADIMDIQQAVESVIYKDEDYRVIASDVWKTAFFDGDLDCKLNLILVAYALGFSGSCGDDVSQGGLLFSGNVENILNSLVFLKGHKKTPVEVLGRMRLFCEELSVWNLDTNTAAVVCFCAMLLLDSTNVSEQLFYRELSLFLPLSYGPYHDHGMTLATIALAATPLHPRLTEALKEMLPNSRIKRRGSVSVKLEPIARQLAKDKFGAGFAKDILHKAAQEKMRKRKLDLGLHNNLKERKDRFRKFESLSLSDLRHSFANELDTQSDYYWEALRTSEILPVHLRGVLELSFDEQLSEHWGEALKVSLKTALPKALKRNFDPEEWNALTARMQNGSQDDDDVNFTAWLILFDIWISLRTEYGVDEESPIAPLARAAGTYTQPKIKLAIAMRDYYQGGKSNGDDLLELLKTDSAAFDVFVKAGWPEDEFFLATRSSLNKARSKFDSKAKDLASS